MALFLHCASFLPPLFTSVTLHPVLFWQILVFFFTDLTHGVGHRGTSFFSVPYYFATSKALHSCTQADFKSLNKSHSPEDEACVTHEEECATFKCERSFNFLWEMHTIHHGTILPNMEH
jgi:hypothetical protein